MDHRIHLSFHALIPKLFSSASANKIFAYAQSLYTDANATLAGLREAVETLEETARTARRVLGAAHPDAVGIEGELRDARAALNAREPPQS